MAKSRRSLGPKWSTRRLQLPPSRSLEIEVGTLTQLEELARRLRGQGVDAKWLQLSGLLETAEAMFTPDGARRKLLIFTEHRDTMNYLVDRLRIFLGDHDAVVNISGSTPREERRSIQARFTQDEGCLVLVATDAAGEGINLQRAHLVINYDLPWNPNRIEQRFGRVHRIGQTEVCHMWNLVAADTREAQVYIRLLAKIEQQRIAYAGQVFDVLGEALSGAELRRLLLDAIRYGDDPEVRDRINQVIDDTVEGRIRDAIEHPPLAEETLAFTDVERIRVEMQEASARRLQPHYIRAFFLAAMAHLGGKITEREPGRFQLAAVPPSVRARDRQIGAGAPLLTRYERITFDKELIRQPGAPPAELLAPGHPLLAATIDLLLERHAGLFTQGTVLVDDSDTHNEPRVLVMLEHAIADGRPTRTAPHTVVSRRFEFVEIDGGGNAIVAGYAPYLDYRPPTEAELSRIDDTLQADWLTADLEAVGTNHAIGVAIPDHLARVRLHTEARVDATLAAVRSASPARSTTGITVPTSFSSRRRRARCPRPTSTGPATAPTGWRNDLRVEPLNLRPSAAFEPCRQPSSVERSSSRPASSQAFRSRLSQKRLPSLAPKWNGGPLRRSSKPSISSAGKPKTSTRRTATIPGTTCVPGRQELTAGSAT